MSSAKEEGGALDGATLYLQTLPSLVPSLCHLKAKGIHTKGQLNSEWIDDVIVSPKMPPKIFKYFCPESLLEGRVEIPKILVGILGETMTS